MFLLFDSSDFIKHFARIKKLFTIFEIAYKLNVSSRSLPSFSEKYTISASDCSQISSSTRSHICIILFENKIDCYSKLQNKFRMNAIYRRTTYPFTFEFIFYFGILETWSKIYANRCILVNRNGWIIGTSVNIFESNSLKFSIFKEYYSTSGHSFEVF